MPRMRPLDKVYGFCMSIPNISHVAISPLVMLLVAIPFGGVPDVIARTNLDHEKW